MKVKDLTHEDLEQIADSNPEWVADNRIDWMAEYCPVWLAFKHPEWMAEHHPKLMVLNNPEWMADHNPYWMAEHRPDLMVENRLEWMVNNRPNWVKQHRPDLMKKYKPDPTGDFEVPKDILKILNKDGDSLPVQEPTKNTPTPEDALDLAVSKRNDSMTGCVDTITVPPCEADKQEIVYIDKIRQDMIDAGADVQSAILRSLEAGKYARDAYIDEHDRGYLIGVKWRKQAFDDAVQMLRDLCETLKVMYSNNSDAPGHSHRVRGKWDIDGKPCQWCKQWKTVLDFLEHQNIQ